MSVPPQVSVIVCTFNRSRLLSDCLDSLLDQTYPRDRYEIIVVDDGSKDKTRDVLDDFVQKSPLVKCFSQTNAGLSAARNTGIKNSSGEIICFTDDDCIATKDWIERLVSGYAEGIGGVGGRIIAKNLDSIVERYSEKSKFFDQEAFRDIFIIGANSSYLKVALGKAGYFDEAFRYAGDDVDMGVRVRSGGYKFVYVKDAIVYHNHRSSLRDMIKQVYGYGKSYARLHKKYPAYFNISLRFMKLSRRLVRKIFFLPFKLFRVFFEGGDSLAFAEPFLDVFILVADIKGLVSETYFGPRYEGPVIREKLSFINQSALLGGYGE
jgi:glycosyltransferase involved in cell wall biosynthesis